MADKYRGFAELAAVENEGTAYKMSATQRSSPVAILVPHGGMIEPGAMEIATAVAADTFSLYCFEARTLGLHITSTRFDEPSALSIVSSSQVGIGIHGRRDEGDKETVWLGGLDHVLRELTGQALRRASFRAKTTGHRLPGEDPNNICNRGRSKAGVQLEIPRSLRVILLASAPLLTAFAVAVRDAIRTGIRGA